MAILSNYFAGFETADRYDHDTGHNQAFLYSVYKQKFSRQCADSQSVEPQSQHGWESIKYALFFRSKGP